MQDLPNIVVQRLQNKAPENFHPEAELLTAFAEQALPEFERRKVIEHLSLCFECREIVALAFPKLEAAQTTLKLPRAGRNWLAWPVVRSVFVGAGVLAVATFGVVRYQQHLSSEHALESKVDRRDSLPAPLTAPESTDMSGGAKNSPGLAAPTSQGAPVKPQESSSRELRSIQRSSGGDAVAAAHAARIGPHPQGGIGGGYFASQSSGAPQVASQSAIQLSAENDSPDQLIRSNRTVAGSSEDVVKAKPAAPASSAPAVARSLAPAATLQTAPSFLKRAFPLWTVNSSGSLQRSFDAGKSWEEIHPVAGAENSLSTKTAFRAVAAVGPEVWAGGNNAALYHSSDSGNQWQPVIFSSPVSPSGDVTSIQFSDPQHGNFATSTGEVWATSDNGQTWQKQQ